ncbi:MAG: hypothetical protein AAGH15_25250, partial [Myxococcota bacterium]
MMRALAAAVFVAALATPAVAQSNPVRGEVFVVLAKEEPGTIDARLGDMAALRRPPFDSFRSMELLQQRRVTLRAAQNQDIELPNGRTLRIRLERVMPDGRYRVQVSIKRPSRPDYLPLLQVVASPGDPFFVVGQAHDGGTLVIGIRLSG